MVEKIYGKGEFEPGNEIVNVWWRTRAVSRREMN